MRYRVVVKRGATEWPVKFFDTQEDASAFVSQNQRKLRAGWFYLIYEVRK